MPISSRRAVLVVVGDSIRTIEAKIKPGSPIGEERACGRRSDPISVVRRADTRAYRLRIDKLDGIYCHNNSGNAAYARREASAT